MTGCFSTQKRDARPPPRARVIVVAPVVNLSGSSDFDPIRITDSLAAEFLAFPNIAVVPVNLTLAALARRGKTRVASPQDALILAEDLGAEATVVMAVTEYDPYKPPRIGVVLQWYEAISPRSADMRDSASATRGVADESETASAPRPRWQVQQVYNAAEDWVQSDVKRYADERDGHGSPYSWRRYLVSQELYVRYCCWAIIRSMLAQEEKMSPRLGDSGLQDGFMQSQRRTLTMVKGEHRYVFWFNEGDEPRLLEHFIALASDRDNSFDWYDAAVLSYQMGKHASKAVTAVMT